MTTMVKDPVCGMEVNPDIARAQGLIAEHGGEAYYFCGRGCKLDFTDDPERILDPAYQPSM